MTELARGGSHIASALSAPSRQAAIDEVISDFRKSHTNGDIRAFLELLADSVTKRGAEAAAIIIRGML